MKSTVSLDARIFDSGNSRTPPVAPPRKKRSTLKKGSTLPTSFGSGDVVRNGFKDVFVNGGVSRALNYDEIEYIDKDESTVQTRASVETNSGEKSPERKLKVGNKKTDKFFGEALSDHLSDEPIIETTVETVVEAVTAVTPEKDEADRRSSSDKKLFFLMNMLEQDHEDELRYKIQGKEPVEEPLFVARKKEIKKHICDDDDEMHHHHFHKHEKHEKEPCDHNVAPPKPDRDFSKYQANSDEVDNKEKEVIVEKTEEKPRPRRTISRENLPTPPATPSKRKSGAISLPGTPTITIENIDFNTSSSSDNKEENSHEKQSKRPLKLTLSKEDSDIDRIIDEQQPPSTPILTQEIMDRMIKKAYGFHGYHPEDFNEHNHDDGSNLVAPTSKLTTRKISVGRKVSTESAPSIDGESAAPPGSPKQKSADETVQRDYEKLLAATSMNDIIQEIYNKNSDIMIEFQSYLEQSIETSPVINVDEEKEFLNAKGITDSGFRNTPEPPKIPDHEDEIEDNQTFSDSFESTDTEQETVTDIGKITNKVNVTKFNPSRRRESIEDVNGWFNNHLDIDEKKSALTAPLEGAAQPTGYDTHKIFPFGPTISGRRDSMSDEFFAEVQMRNSLSVSSKPLIETVRESKESSISEGDESMQSRENSFSGPSAKDNSRENSFSSPPAKDNSRENSFSREKSPDHSTLLKFLDSESKIN
jgi:hypothetical protein